MSQLNKVIIAMGLGICLEASALDVSPMLVFFNSGSGNIQDLTVSNSQSTINYAQVSPALLESPGQPNSSVKAYQPGSDPKAFGLMVTPEKLAVPSQSSRKVRLVNLNAPVTQDKIYEVTITNISNPTTLVSHHGESEADMTIHYGYKATVFVLPAHPLPVVSAVRSGTQVTFKNTGNSYLSLRNGELCNTEGKKCAPLPSQLTYHLLYAGTSWTMTLPTEGVVKFNGVYDQTKQMPVQSN